MSSFATILMLNSVLLSYSSAQTRHHLNSSFYVQQCPPLSYYDEDSHECQCFDHVKCSDNAACLRAGYCATYDNDTEIQAGRRAKRASLCTRVDHTPNYVHNICYI